MSIVEGYTFEPMVGDPDDHRPETRWALLVHPGGPGSEADDPQRGATYDFLTGEVTFDA